MNLLEGAVGRKIEKAGGAAAEEALRAVERIPAKTDIPQLAVADANRNIDALLRLSSGTVLTASIVEADSATKETRAQAAAQQLQLGIAMLDSVAAGTGNKDAAWLAQRGAEYLEAGAYAKAYGCLALGNSLLPAPGTFEEGSAVDKMRQAASGAEEMGAKGLEELFSSGKAGELIGACNIETAAKEIDAPALALMDSGARIQKLFGKGEAEFIFGAAGSAQGLALDAIRLSREGKMEEASKALGQAQLIMGSVVDYVAALELRREMKPPAEGKEEYKALVAQAEKGIGEMRAGISGAAGLEKAALTPEMLAEMGQKAAESSHSVMEASAKADSLRLAKSIQGYAGAAGNRLEGAVDYASEKIREGQFGEAREVVHLALSYKETFEKGSYAGIAAEWETLEEARKAAGLRAGEDELLRGRAKLGRVLDFIISGGESEEGRRYDVVADLRGSAAALASVKAGAAHVKGQRDLHAEVVAEAEKNKVKLDPSKAEEELGKMAKLALKGDAWGAWAHGFEKTSIAIADERSELYVSLGATETARQVLLAQQDARQLNSEEWNLANSLGANAEALRGAVTLEKGMGEKANVLASHSEVAADSLRKHAWKLEELEAKAEEYRGKYLGETAEKPVAEGGREGERLLKGQLEGIAQGKYLVSVGNGMQAITGDALALMQLTLSGGESIMVGNSARRMSFMNLDRAMGNLLDASYALCGFDRYAKGPLKLADAEDWKRNSQEAYSQYKEAQAEVGNALAVQWSPTVQYASGEGQRAAGAEAYARHKQDAFAALMGVEAEKNAGSAARRAAGADQLLFAAYNITSHPLEVRISGESTSANMRHAIDSMRGVSSASSPFEVRAAISETQSQIAYAQMNYDVGLGAEGLLRFMAITLTGPLALPIIGADLIYGAAGEYPRKKDYFYTPEFYKTLGMGFALGAGKAARALDAIGAASGVQRGLMAFHNSAFTLLTAEGTYAGAQMLHDGIENNDLRAISAGTQEIFKTVPFLAQTAHPGAWMEYDVGAAFGRGIGYFRRPAAIPAEAGVAAGIVPTIEVAAPLRGVEPAPRPALEAPKPAIERPAPVREAPKPPEKAPIEFKPAVKAGSARALGEANVLGKATMENGILTITSDALGGEIAHRVRPEYAEQVVKGRFVEAKEEIKPTGFWASWGPGWETFLRSAPGLLEENVKFNTELRSGLKLFLLDSKKSYDSMMAEFRKEVKAAPSRKYQEGLWVERESRKNYEKSPWQWLKEKGYDGVAVTEDGARDTNRYYVWDAASVIIFAPEGKVRVPDGEARLKEYHEGPEGRIDALLPRIMGGLNEDHWKAIRVLDLLKAYEMGDKCPPEIKEHLEKEDLSFVAKLREERLGLEQAADRIIRRVDPSASLGPAPVAPTPALEAPKPAIEMPVAAREAPERALAPEAEARKAREFEKEVVASKDAQAVMSLARSRKAEARELSERAEEAQYEAVLLKAEIGEGTASYRAALARAKRVEALSAEMNESVRRLEAEAKRLGYVELVAAPAPRIAVREAASPVQAEVEKIPQLYSPKRELYSDGTMRVENVAKGLDEGKMHIEYTGAGEYWLDFTVRVEGMEGALGHNAIGFTVPLEVSAGKNVRGLIMDNAQGAVNRFLGEGRQLSPEELDAVLEGRVAPRPSELEVARAERDLRDLPVQLARINEKISERKAKGEDDSVLLSYREDVERRMNEANDRLGRPRIEFERERAAVAAEEAEAAVKGRAYAPLFPGGVPPAVLTALPKEKLPVEEQVSPVRMVKLASMADERVFEGKANPPELSAKDQRIYDKLVRVMEREVRIAKVEGRVPYRNPLHFIESFMGKYVMDGFSSEKERKRFMDSVEPSTDFAGKFVTEVSNSPFTAAFGDIHGDVYALFGYAKRAGLLIDKRADLPVDDASVPYWERYGRNPKLPRGEVVLTGDYIDRGTKSFEVLDSVRWLKAELAKDGITVHTLRGNHEELFRRFVRMYRDMDTELVWDQIKNMDEGTKLQLGLSWKSVGIDETFASALTRYNAGKTFNELLIEPDAWRNAVKGMEKDGTLQFIENLGGAVIIDGYYYTHGGPVLKFSLEEIDAHFEKIFSDPANVWSNNYLADEVAKKYRNAIKNGDFSAAYMSEWYLSNEKDIKWWMAGMGITRVVVGHERGTEVRASVKVRDQNGDKVLIPTPEVINIDAAMSHGYGGHGGVLVVDPRAEEVATIITGRDPVKSIPGEDGAPSASSALWWVNYKGGDKLPPEKVIENEITRARELPLPAVTAAPILKVGVPAAPTPGPRPLSPIDVDAISTNVASKGFMVRKEYGWIVDHVKSGANPVSQAGVENALMVAGGIKMPAGYSFEDVSTRESIGGNAGLGKFGVNGFYDPQTKSILLFGNIQRIPQGVRDRGEPFALIVDMQNTGKIVKVAGGEPGKPLPAELLWLEGMKITVPIKETLEKLRGHAEELPGTAEAPAAGGVQREAAPAFEVVSHSREEVELLGFGDRYSSRVAESASRLRGGEEVVKRNVEDLQESMLSMEGALRAISRRAGLPQGAEMVESWLRISDKMMKEAERLAPGPGVLRLEEYHTSLSLVEALVARASRAENPLGLLKFVEKMEPAQMRDYLLAAKKVGAPAVAAVDYAPVKQSSLGIEIQGELSRILSSKGTPSEAMVRFIDYLDGKGILAQQIGWGKRELAELLREENGVEKACGKLNAVLMHEGIAAATNEESGNLTMVQVTYFPKTGKGNAAIVKRLAGFEDPIAGGVGVYDAYSDMLLLRHEEGLAKLGPDVLRTYAQHEIQHYLDQVSGYWDGVGKNSVRIEAMGIASQLRFAEGWGGAKALSILSQTAASGEAGIPYIMGARRILKGTSLGALLEKAPLETRKDERALERELVSVVKKELAGVMPAEQITDAFAKGFLNKMVKDELGKFMDNEYSSVLGIGFADAFAKARGVGAVPRIVIRAPEMEGAPLGGGRAAAKELPGAGAAAPKVKGRGKPAETAKLVEEYDERARELAHSDRKAEASELYVKAAQISSKLGDSSGSAFYFERAAANIKDADPRKAVELYEKSADAHLKSGELSEARHRRESAAEAALQFDTGKAIELYEVALREAGTSEYAVANISIAMGDILLASDPQRAAALFESAADAQMVDANMWNQFESAKEIYRKAINALASDPAGAQRAAERASKKFEEAGDKLLEGMHFSDAAYTYRTSADFTRSSDPLGASKLYKKSADSYVKDSQYGKAKEIYLSVVELKGSSDPEGTRKMLEGASSKMENSGDKNLKAWPQMSAEEYTTAADLLKAYNPEKAMALYEKAAGLWIKNNTKRMAGVCYKSMAELVKDSDPAKAILLFEKSVQNFSESSILEAFGPLEELYKLEQDPVKKAERGKELLATAALAGQWRVLPATAKSLAPSFSALMEEEAVQNFVSRIGAPMNLEQLEKAATVFQLNRKEVGISVATQEADTKFLASGAAAWAEGGFRGLEGVPEWFLFEAWAAGKGNPEKTAIIAKILGTKDLRTSRDRRKALRWSLEGLEGKREEEFYHVVGISSANKMMDNLKSLSVLYNLGIDIPLKKIGTEEGFIAFADNQLRSFVGQKTASEEVKKKFVQRAEELGSNGFLTAIVDTSARYREFPGATEAMDTGFIAMLMGDFAKVKFPTKEGIESMGYLSEKQKRMLLKQAGGLDFLGNSRNEWIAGERVIKVAPESYDKVEGARKDLAQRIADMKFHFKEHMAAQEGRLEEGFSFEPAFLERVRADISELEAGGQQKSKEFIKLKQMERILVSVGELEALDPAEAKEKAPQIKTTLRNLGQSTAALFKNFYGMKVEDLESLQAKMDVDLLSKMLLEERENLRVDKLVAYDSADPVQLILAGKQPENSGSCQRHDGTPHLMIGLSGYFLNSHVKIIRVENQDGIVLGRAMLKAVTADGKPAIFLERAYYRNSKSDPGVDDLILELAKRKAQEMGVPLLSTWRASGTPKEMRITVPAGLSGYEYSDGIGAGGVVKGGRNVKINVSILDTGVVPKIEARAAAEELPGAGAARAEPVSARELEGAFERLARAERTAEELASGRIETAGKGGRRAYAEMLPGTGTGRPEAVTLEERRRDIVLGAQANLELTLGKIKESGMDVVPIEDIGSRMASQNILKNAAQEGNEKAVYLYAGKVEGFPEISISGVEYSLVNIEFRGARRAIVAGENLVVPKDIAAGVMGAKPTQEPAAVFLDTCYLLSLCKSKYSIRESISHLKESYPEGTEIMITSHVMEELDRQAGNRSRRDDNGEMLLTRAQFAEIQQLGFEKAVEVVKMEITEAHEAEAAEMLEKQSGAKMNRGVGEGELSIMLAIREFRELFGRFVVKSIDSDVSALMGSVAEVSP